MLLCLLRQELYGIVASLDEYGLNGVSAEKLCMTYIEQGISKFYHCKGDGR